MEPVAKSVKSKSQWLIPYNSRLNISGISWKFQKQNLILKFNFFPSQLKCGCQTSRIHFLLLRLLKEATSPFSNIIKEIFIVLYWNLLVKGWKKQEIISRSVCYYWLLKWGGDAVWETMKVFENCQFVSLALNHTLHSNFRL